MRWDEHLDGLLDDLEQQAEGLALAERDALVAEQRRAEYAAVDLSGRLHASVGDALRLDVRGWSGRRQPAPRRRWLVPARGRRAVGWGGMAGPAGRGAVRTRALGTVARPGRPAGHRTSRARPGPARRGRDPRGGAGPPGGRHAGPGRAGPGRSRLRGEFDDETRDGPEVLPFSALAAVPPLPGSSADLLVGPRVPAARQA